MKANPYHVGVVEFLIVVAYVLLFTFFWRALAARLNDNHPQVAAGMTAIYS